MSVGQTSHASFFDRIAAERAADDSSDQTTKIGRYARRETSRDIRGEIHGDADDSPTGILIDGTGAWPAPDISTQMARPVLADRQCSRSGCSDVAAITLSYHYGQSQVWIDHLTPEREPHMYDMCDRHAGRLSVPRGWHLDDRRRAYRGVLIAV